MGTSKPPLTTKVPTKAPAVKKPVLGGGKPPLKSALKPAGKPVVKGKVGITGGKPKSIAKQSDSDDDDEDSDEDDESESEEESSDEDEAPSSKMTKKPLPGANKSGLVLKSPRPAVITRPGVPTQPFRPVAPRILFSPRGTRPPLRPPGGPGPTPAVSEAQPPSTSTPPSKFPAGNGPPNFMPGAPPPSSYPPSGPYPPGPPHFQNNGAPANYRPPTPNNGTGTPPYPPGANVPPGPGSFPPNATHPYQGPPRPPGPNYPGGPSAPHYPPMHGAPGPHPSAPHPSGPHPSGAPHTGPHPPGAPHTSQQPVGPPGPGGPYAGPGSPFMRAPTPVQFMGDSTGLDSPVTSPGKKKGARGRGKKAGEGGEVQEKTGPGPAVVPSSGPGTGKCCPVCFIELCAEEVLVALLPIANLIKVRLESVCILLNINIWGKIRFNTGFLLDKIRPSFNFSSSNSLRKLLTRFCWMLSFGFRFPVILALHCKRALD